MKTRYCLSLAIALACSRASADPQLSPEARTHFDKAMTAYDAKRYDEALDELHAAYAIDPRPDLVYAEAQALRMAGRCREAIEAYRRFLALRPPADETAKAERHIARCGDSLHVESTIELHVPPAAPAPVETAPPWYSDRLGIALTAGGIAGVGLGIGLAVAASHARNAAMGATDYMTFLRDADREATQTLGSRIGFAAGGVLVTLAVLRFVF